MRRCRITRGRATSASCATRSSTPCCSPTADDRCRRAGSVARGRRRRRPPPASSDQTLKASEIQEIMRALQAEGGRVERAAQRLGVPRSSLYQKIRKYGIAIPKATLDAVVRQGSAAARRDRAAPPARRRRRRCPRQTAGTARRARWRCAGPRAVHITISASIEKATSVPRWSRAALRDQAAAIGVSCGDRPDRESRSPGRSAPRHHVTPVT